MRPLERVRRTRRTLAAAIAVRAALWGVCTAFIVGAIGIVMTRRAGASTTAAVWALAAVATLGVLVQLLAAWRRLTVPRVALWIEERVPRLEYALVTAVDPVGSDALVSAALNERIAAISWQSETRRAVLRAVARPTVGPSRNVTR